MEWLNNLVKKYRRWKEDMELRAALRRQVVQQRLDKAIEIENDKAIIRVKKKKLMALKNKGRPSVSKSFKPNYFGKGFNSEKVDYFKGFK